MHEGDISSVGLQFLDLELRKRKELLESFTYNCSHSIRSPLKTMEGIVKLLRQYPDAAASDGTDYRALLKTEAERLQSIVLQFEELRINSENELNLKTVSIEKMLERVVNPLKARMQKSGICIKTHINQKGQFVSDVSRIETVLSELLSNAIQFHDLSKGQPEISVYVTASSSSCSIQVHDNGSGIRNNDIPRIFDLFFRASESSEGSGLGLFVVTQVLEKMKGTISVQSILNRGTVFSLWIPNRNTK